MTATAVARDATVEPARRFPDPHRARLAAAAGSGLLLALAFPPPDLGPLALVALVPLLWAWDDAGPGAAALYGLTSGVVFFGIVLSWTWYFGAIAIVPLVFATAAYWAATGALVGLLRRLGIRSVWLTAAAWVALEALRDRWPLGGFAWGEAGAALHSLSPARALASWGGVPLVTFVVVLVNGLLLDVWRARRDRSHAARALTALGLAGVLAATTVAVAFRYQPRTTGHLRFAMLQGNDQDRRLTPQEIASGYLTRKHLALAATLRGHYDLIVFPESALEHDPEADPTLRAQLVALGRAHGAAVLVNAVTDGSNPDRIYNTNRLYTPDGRLQGSYAKQHLVPYGEHVPFRHELSFIGELQQIPRDFSPGHTTRVFEVAGHRVGTVICFESAFSPLVRKFVRKGSELIVVSTNNRSYRRSGNAAQHLALSQMRAAETARPVLQASISGITGVIDASGRVRRTNGLFHNAVIQGVTATTTGETPFVRYGDWVEWGSVAALVGALAVAIARRRMRA